MPREAVKLGTADRCLPFGTIAGEIARLASPRLARASREQPTAVSCTTKSRPGGMRDGFWHGVV